MVIGGAAQVAINNLNNNLNNNMNNVHDIGYGFLIGFIMAISVIIWVEYGKDFFNRVFKQKEPHDISNVDNQFYNLEEERYIAPLGQYRIKQ